MKLPDKVYNVLKWIALIVLPALAVLYATVGQAWGWPHIEAICITINAVATFIGALIGVSHLTMKKEQQDEDS